MHNQADSIGDLYSGLQTEIFNRIIYYLKDSKYKNVGPDKVLMWQTEQLSKMGMLTNDVIKLLSQVTGVAQKRIKSMVMDSGLQIDDESSSQLSNLTNHPKINTDNRQLLSGILEQTYSDMNNVVNQSLISTNYYNNSAVRTYQNIVNQSTIETISGLKTLDRAVADNVYKWSQAGLKSTIPDKRGHKWSLEGYSRMVLQSTAHSTYNQVRMSNMSEYGVTLAVMSSHMSARPACAPIQGKIVNTIPESAPGYNPKYDSIYNHGYGLAGGTQGANCRHELYPYREGVSSNPFDAPDPDEAIKNGKIQAKQRALERRIRNDKKMLAEAKHLGDQKGIAHYKSMLSNHRSQVRTLVDEHSFLHRDYSREKLLTPKPSVPLSTEERRAVTNYVGTSYIGINDSLRNNYPMTEMQKATVKHIDTALDKLPKYNSDKPLYRSYTFNNNRDLANFVKNKNIGKVFTNSAYTSTGKPGFQENEDIRMTIKKSQNGRILGDLNTLGDEVLFKRNTKFKITNKYIKNGLAILEVEEYVPKRRRKNGTI